MLEHCALALQHADMSADVPELQADAAQAYIQPQTPGPEYHMIGTSRDLVEQQYTLVDMGATANLMGQPALQELQQALQNPLQFPDDMAQNFDPNRLQ